MQIDSASGIDNSGTVSPRATRSRTRHYRQFRSIAAQGNTRFPRRCRQPHQRQRHSLLGAGLTGRQPGRQWPPRGRRQRTNTVHGQAIAAGEQSLVAVRSICRQSKQPNTLT